MGSQQFYECVRCDRDFRSLAAKEQHLRDSSRHNICQLCGVRDYEDADDLDDHLEDDHHFCTGCRQIFSSNWLLQQHNVDVHNLCVTCGRYFTSPSNLNNHKIIHAEKNIECAGCNRQFATNSAMVLHLEAGTCPSEADCQVVDDLATDCRQYPSYRCDDPKYDYECPSCETPFRYMSGLLQHIENGPCDESLDWHRPLAIFLRYIRTRI
ncbi:uncharacterized protein NECHADRAFT_51843 [Fusarium vanettenii 77-13-4]|uniref:C2H2-type domain-containing protein n=1 Tax=Fusarium vanettenii (strain ATCC MYA-4622 / CBS 123669 / FGSC 9596 / NRRL 45880 / 77-13-4) TaxID=660122 RepID=C7ZHB1_FUSV7|nr:uncharacterized protein NECHADRAFT_51843 [Fusarium vanettenii 77-13-4]EEU36720.1 hypothetical protein NECHADRAFT_51843 [Fusarium vanettenii 77-13-4]